MNPKRFYTGLGITIAVQFVINLILVQVIPALEAHTSFILVSILIMAIFCFLLYLAALRMARSPLTRMYIQLIMVAVFIKLFMCLALIVIYKKVFQPADHSFIWSFLIIYITSTIFEVVFLEKVGRLKNPPAA